MHESSLFPSGDRRFGYALSGVDCEEQIDRRDSTVASMRPLLNRWVSQ